MDAPAIVVAAYDRPESLKRLLNSLAQAVYPSGEIPLIISIDHSQVQKCTQLAHEFAWPHGKKELIQHPEHLGLKAHILSCGDLTSEYGSIILLEDDLIVSPHFYDYAQSALIRYQDAKEIGGVSLYAYEITENAFAPFQPLADDSDVYFLQFPSSWGQAWTRDHWANFRKWLASHPDVEKTERIPHYLKEWPTTSWKKHFARYLLATQRFFVYPCVSHTTNFSDPGTHADTAALFQVPLALTPREYNFPDPKDSFNRYDIFFEILPEALNTLTDRFSGKNFTVDLYGRKDLDFLDGEFILTTRPSPRLKTRFGLKMFPAVLNLVYEVNGSGIYWGRMEKASPFPQSRGANYYRWASVVPQLMDSTHRSSRPRISLVVPIHAPQASLGLASLWNSSPPDVEVILVHNEPIQHLPPEVDNTILIQIEPGSTPFQMIGKGLENATGEIMGVIPQGSVLEKDAIEKLKALFRDFEQVKWITGQSRHAKVRKPQLSMAKQRVLLEKSPHISLNDWPRALALGQVFWRRDLWERTGGRFRSELGAAAPMELWIRFWKQVPPTVVKQSWSARILSPPFLWHAPDTPPDSLKSLPASRANPPGLGRKAFAALFRPFFKWDWPGFRFAYYELEQLPDVLIYDPRSEKFYFWRY